MPIGPADQILGLADPAPASQVSDLSRVDALGDGKVEGVEGLRLWEPGVSDALAHRRLGARLHLDGEDLVQEVLEGPPLLTRLTSQRLIRTQQARHLERPRVGLDHLGDDDLSAHRPPPSSASKSAADAAGTSTPWRLAGRAASSTSVSRVGCTSAR